MFDHKALQTLEYLEEGGQLSNRELTMMQIIRDVREETFTLAERLATLEAEILEIRSQCRRERGEICKLYEIEIREGSHD